MSHRAPISMLCAAAAALLAGLALLATPASAQSSLGPQERLLVGKTNEARVREGIAPLEISETLSRSAQSYADYLATRGVLSHTADGRTPQKRASAVGWPDPDFVTENLTSADNGGGAFASLYAEGPGGGHYENLMDDSRATVGVGHNAAGQVWAVEYGRSCSESSCGMTGDFGDASIPPSADAPPRSQSPAPAPSVSPTGQDPRVRVGHPRVYKRHHGSAEYRSHRVVTVNVLDDADADRRGHLTVRVTGSGGYKKWVRPDRTDRHGKSHYLHFRIAVTQRGELKFQARYTPDDGGYAPQRVNRTVTVR